MATYVPQAVLAAIQGQLYGNPSAFINDFAAMIQYLVAVPLLIIADSVAGPLIDAAILHFMDSGLLSVKDSQGFAQETNKALRIIKSRYLDIAAVILGLIIPWTWIIPSLTAVGQHPSIQSWKIISGYHGPRLSYAILYAGLIASPFFLYMHFRWIVKVAGWVWIIIRVSRRNLRINPCHPDKAGGLYFLSRVQSAFGIFIFTIGCEIATTVSYNIFINGSALFSFENASMWVSFITLAPLVFMLPLILFSKRLFWAKSDGLFLISRFSNTFSNAFSIRHLDYISITSGERMNVDTKRDAGLFLDDIGGDVQSLADLQNSFDTLRAMKIIPFDFASLGKLMAAAAGPMLPIFFRSIPSLEPVVDFISGMF